MPTYGLRHIITNHGKIAVTTESPVAGDGKADSILKEAVMHQQSVTAPDVLTWLWFLPIDALEDNES